MVSAKKLRKKSFSWHTSEKGLLSREWTENCRKCEKTQIKCATTTMCGFTGPVIASSTVVKSYTHCGNSRFYLSQLFYVKSIWVNYVPISKTVVCEWRNELKLISRKIWKAEGDFVFSKPSYTVNQLHRSLFAHIPLNATWEPKMWFWEV